MSRTRGAAMTMAVVLAVVIVVSLLRRPILIRIVDPTEVSGLPILVIVNPLRDKEPERLAEAVLRKLQERDLKVAFAALAEDVTADIRENETKYPVEHWRLINRKDRAGDVELTYSVSRKTSPPARTTVVIRVTETRDSMTITDFAPVY